MPDWFVYDNSFRFTNSLRDAGKNVLHPNVGFMWEIIDHMWDDPTFFNYHFGC